MCYAPTLVAPVTDPGAADAAGNGMQQRHASSERTRLLATNVRIAGAGGARRAGVAASCPRPRCSLQCGSAAHGWLRWRCRSGARTPRNMPNGEWKMYDEAERERESRALKQLLYKNVVTIGGGTGPFALLTNLKRYPCTITAIVTMSDSGGSSRRLMDEFGQLPLGDLRQALVALSRKGVLWRDVFTFRFRQGRGQRSSPPQERLEGKPGDSYAQ